jgi:hypothetical protein
VKKDSRPHKTVAKLLKYPLKRAKKKRGAGRGEKKRKILIINLSVRV